MSVIEDLTATSSIPAGEATELQKSVTEESIAAVDESSNGESSKTDLDISEDDEAGDERPNGVAIEEKGQSKMPEEYRPATRTIYVGNLNFRVEPRHVEDLFSFAGPITKVKLVSQPVTRRPCGYGFVTFENEESVERAIEKLDKAEFWLRPLLVKKKEVVRPDQEPSDSARGSDSDSNRGSFRGRGKGRGRGGGRGRGRGFRGGFRGGRGGRGSSAPTETTPKTEEQSASIA